MELQELPIDISYSKLADFLVDRRKLPADWRKRLEQIRSKVAPALSRLPKEADPWFTILTPESVGYAEAKKIKAIISESVPVEKTLFGRLSGVAGEWDAIVRAYEKDSVFLGEASQIMTQNVNYEMPFYKKQIAKAQQQLADLERKEAEYKRNAAAAEHRYRLTCQELGIEGKNVRAELLATVKALPGVFKEVLDILCSFIVTRAIEHYETFVTYAHSAQKEDILPTLKDLHSNPAAYTFAEGAFEQEVKEETRFAVNEQAEIKTETNSQVAQEDESTIEWDIDLSASVDAASADEENGEAQIAWDIDVEDGGTIHTEEQNTQLSASEAALNESKLVQVPLVDMSYRNRILNDIFEVKAFLTHRIRELEDAASSVQHQMQAAIQNDGAQTLSDMSAELSKAVSLLTSSRTRDILMILTSSKFLNKLEESLLQKKHTEARATASLEAVHVKRVELQSTLSSSWAKQDEFLSKTRQLKSEVEKSVSSMYNGRLVHIIGEINNLL